MKTYKNVLDETVEYYKTHPRALDHDRNCQYFTEGKMCAVGRCLHNPEIFGDMNITAHDLFVEQGMSILRPEYRGLSNTEFWTHLQELHDRHHYWEGNSLTEAGEDFYKYILNRIERGEYE
jgi:hypothetical protein